MCFALARSLANRAPWSRTYLAESRDSTTAMVRRRSGLWLLPDPEVKVRRVGTGCARIHFFGLALDFFSFLPAGEARGISSHVCTDLAYMAGTMRYPLPSRIHSLVCISRSSLSLFLSFLLARSPVLLAHRSLACTHTCIRDRVFHPGTRTISRSRALIVLPDAPAFVKKFHDTRSADSRRSFGEMKRSELLTHVNETRHVPWILD